MQTIRRHFSVVNHRELTLVTNGSATAELPLFERRLSLVNAARSPSRYKSQTDAVSHPRSAGMIQLDSQGNSSEKAGHPPGDGP